MRSVGRNIAGARVAAGVTQEALASKLGLAARYVQDVEAGAIIISVTRLIDFAWALQLHPGKLLDGFDPPEDSQ